MRCKRKIEVVKCKTDQGKEVAVSKDFLSGITWTATGFGMQPW